MESSNNPVPTAATPPRQYRGVRLDPTSGLWAAYVTVGDRAGHLIGHFNKQHSAALAHDRVALFFLLGTGGAATAGGAINFPPSFSAMELLFLRRRCTEEFLLRAVLDHIYEAAFEDFLFAAFHAYRWRDDVGDDGETARAVAECVARVRETPEWRRVAGDVEAASYCFVMGHLNPVLCGSWVPFFHEMGDPNRSFFTCEEAHEWEAACSRRRAAEQEEEEAQRKRLEIEMAAAAALEEGDKEHQELPEKTSSHAMPRVSSSTALRFLKRWLHRTCFFGEEQQVCDEEEQVPLL